MRHLDLQHLNFFGTRPLDSPQSNSKLFNNALKLIPLSISQLPHLFYVLIELLNLLTLLVAQGY